MRLSASDIRALAQELFALILDGRGTRRKWHQHGGNEQFCGFIELWRMACERKDGNHEAWVRQEIEKALAVNLRFANDIFYYWCSTQQNIVDPDEAVRLRAASVKRARELFEGDAGLLSSALESTYAYTLHHFVKFYSEHRFGGQGFKPDEWKWIADVLLKAAKQKPQVLVPQIVFLLFDFPLEPVWKELKFQEEFAKTLFNENVYQIMEALTYSISIKEFDEQTRSGISLAQEFAGNWLRERSEGLHEPPQSG